MPPHQTGLRAHTRAHCPGPSVPPVRTQRSLPQFHPKGFLLGCCGVLGWGAPGGARRWWGARLPAGRALHGAVQGAPPAGVTHLPERARSCPGSLEEKRGVTGGELGSHCLLAALGALPEGSLPQPVAAVGIRAGKAQTELPTPRGVPNCCKPSALREQPACASARTVTAGSANRTALHGLRCPPESHCSRAFPSN